jgi:hypothetical protein
MRVMRDAPRSKVIADYEIFTVPGINPFTGEVRQPVRSRDSDTPSLVDGEDDARNPSAIDGESLHGSKPFLRK